MLGQMEETIPMSSLHSADVVGLYFAAYSSPSCQEFTPKLAELYNECKDKNKKFEIVFVSSDRDEDAFNKYFIEMPWCALIFNERSVKEELSELFGVSGIPCLVLLTGKGDLITKEGISAVGAGIDAFPWNKKE